MKREIALKVLERGASVIMTNKLLSEMYATIETWTEEDKSLRACQFGVIAEALGETLETFEYPKNCERLLSRKDCPKYMREMQIMNVNAYYPKLSLPKEKNWVTIERGYDDNFENTVQD